MLFWGAREYVRIIHCGCGLSAGASWLLGGKGLGGGPDETEKHSFSLTYTFMYRKQLDKWFLFSQQVQHAVIMFEKYYGNHQI